MNAARPLLISGPTASGKSALALAEAQKGGVVINADAAQVYDGWRILTARPSEADLAAAPHRLYGHVDPARRYSVGDWLRDAAVALSAARAEGLRPIFVGGTGLYFTALTKGLADIPPPDEAIRRAVGDRLTTQGAPALAAELSARDPETAAVTDLANPMRVTRALEVLDATGRGLAAWRAETPPPLIAEVDRVVIAPDRAALYARCDHRFDQMLVEGALDEAAAMLDRNLDHALPSMKVLGAPQLFSHLKGAATLAEAADAARRATRNYAKRQMTWMRNQLAEWPRRDV